MGLCKIIIRPLKAQALPNPQKAWKDKWKDLLIKLGRKTKWLNIYKCNVWGKIKKDNPKTWIITIKFNLPR